MALLNLEKIKERFPTWQKGKLTRRFFGRSGRTLTILIRDWTSMQIAQMTQRGHDVRDTLLWLSPRQ